LAYKRFYSRDPKVITERILDAAEAEFAIEGFTGASTNRIVEQFGGSKATLFRYYPTKSELFVAVMRRISERLLAKIDWTALDVEDPESWLTTFTRMSLRASLSEDALFVGRMVVAHGREFPDVRKTFIAVAVEPVLTALASFFREAARKDQLHCTDCVGDAMRFFDLAIAGCTGRALLGIWPDHDETFFDLEPARTAALFLKGRLSRP
jgi:AcrR family transcriptional regulator